MRIAALYVEKDGCYSGLPGIDPWDKCRDARHYSGPWPVIAHPPCQRWGKLWAGQPLHIKNTGERKIKGNDEGCFDAALAAVRKYGGVLEHPAESHAWEYFGLNRPPRSGGWIVADFQGGEDLLVIIELAALNEQFGLVRLVDAAAVGTARHASTPRMNSATS